MKHSLRRLFKAPAFALTAIITVGAAIGANALILSVVNGVILKPLPYANQSLGSAGSPRMRGRCCA